MSEIVGQAVLEKSVASLVAASDNPELIATLIPGCDGLHRIDAEHLEGRLATQVSGIPIEAAISIRRTVEVLDGGVTRLHLRLKVRPGQRVEEYLRGSIDHLIAGLAN
jgi:hypothetical protein